MTAGDSRTKLSALRKLFHRLEKISLDLTESEKQKTAFQLLLYAEAIRRFKSAGSCSFTAALKRANEIELKLKSCPALYQSATNWSLAANETNLEKLLPELEKAEPILDLFDERVAGYFYQFSQEGKRSQALKRIQQADKRNSKADLISFTQLYTPDWAADYLLANTIIPQWNLENERIREKLPFLLPDQRRNSTEKTNACKIKILDPAVGAGHILLRAFDLFYLMYEEEGVSKEEAVERILNFNLAGCDLDNQALFVTGFALLLKGRLRSELNFKIELRRADLSQNRHEENALEIGTLNRRVSKDSLLSESFNAVVANPPYIGRRLMDRRMKQFLKSEFPLSHNDLSAAFLERSMELCRTSGSVGFLTQSSLLYLPSFAKLRRNLIESDSIQSVIELGPQVFPLSSGEKINSMLMILRKKAKDESGNTESLFLDLIQSKDKAPDLERQCRSEKRGAQNSFQKIDCREFLESQRQALNYKYPKILIQIVQSSTNLKDEAEIKQGIATSDNARFLRFAWELPKSEIGKRWHPYIKGAGVERWYSPCVYLIDWGSDGRAIKEAVSANYPYLKGKVSWVVKNEQYYFRKGLTFSFVSSGDFAVRALPGGCIFDVGGSALFCNPESEQFLLSYLNSSFAALCARMLSPTLNFQVGDLKQIPIISFSKEDRELLKMRGQEALQLKKELSEFDPATLNYKPVRNFDELLLKEQSPERLWKLTSEKIEAILRRIQAIECEIDEAIFNQVQENYSAGMNPQKAALKSLLSEIELKRKAVQKPFENEKEFAEAILRSFLEMKVENDSNFLSDKKSVFEGQMSESLMLWLEKNLEMSISNYLIKQFNRKQERLFYGSPPLICFEGEEKFAFVDSRELQRRMLDKELKDANFGYKELADKLKGKDGIRGKDILSCLAKSTQF
ncbi:MAG: N-6 DNA methylase [Candidatus Obscuribacterales bacterium]|nr:N-6 DNA methylase [Candidatus Obscuribacterales bacterium]